MTSGAVPGQTPDNLIGQTIWSETQRGVGYRVERLLGQGGTARAYFAVRLAPGGHSPVVLKVILPKIVRESGETALLVIRKEAVALGRLNERMPPTPHVVRFVDTGVLPFSYGYQVLHLPWLALEYVNGGTEGTALDERVLFSVRATGYAFDPDRAARTVDALAHGLEEIHAVDVVHRDLTPSNVLCCGSGDTEIFKISDFGIARTVGLSATFGNVMLGTPGYVAPEQSLAKNVPIGSHTDVFSFAAVVFCMLTGEHYFRARTTVDAYQEVQRVERRSLAEAAALCPELRDKPSAVSALDLALARATSADIGLRPKSARAFAEGILPWLTDQPRSVRVNNRWLGTVDVLRPSPSRIEHTFLVRHPAGSDRLLLGAAWNASGHCLAATPAGLDYFDGTGWSRVPASEALTGRRLCTVERLRPTTFLVSAEGARLVEVAREGTSIFKEGPDPKVDYLGIDGDLEDLAVLIGRVQGAPPLLCPLVGRRWLKPLPVHDVSNISGLGRIEDESWLVTGRSRQGRAWAALYSPLAFELEPLPVPEARALLACASRKSRQAAVAVGGDGAVLFVEQGRSVSVTVPGRPDLSAVTVDAAGQAWMASTGKLWTQYPGGPLECVWHDPNWRSPFVRIHAEMGHLLALAVDGGVLEYRAQMLSPAAQA